MSILMPLLVTALSLPSVPNSSQEPPLNLFPKSQTVETVCQSSYLEGKYERFLCVHLVDGEVFGRILFDVSHSQVPKGICSEVIKTHGILTSDDVQKKLEAGELSKEAARDLWTCHIILHWWGLIRISEQLRALE